MREEPVCNEYHDCEYAELPYGTCPSVSYKYGDNTEDGIVGDYFEGVRCSCMGEPEGYALFDR